MKLEFQRYLLSKNTKGVNLDGLVVCGGEDTKTSCISLSPGAHTWTNYGSIKDRTRHVSWTTRTGELYLMGGADDSGELSTTEIVGVGPGFSLVRNTS